MAQAIGVEELVGRERELAVVVEHVDAVSHGFRALLLVGEPGIGKTTLWRLGVAQARDRAFRILAARPAETETGLSFSGLADLLDGLDDAISALPAPQRRALRVALLREDPAGRAADPRTLSTAFHSLVRNLARDGPVVIAVDDVQWLDSPTVALLSFALRRLDSSLVGFFGTARREPVELAVDGMRRCEIGPLDLDALTEIIHGVLDTRFPRPVLRRVERASGGNPFYALEFARALLRRGGRVAPTEPIPIPETLRELVSERLQALPLSTRRALAAAAAAAHPTAKLVALATGSAGALDAAARAGLIETRDGSIHFTHPLLASVAYLDAAEAERRTLHRRLAEIVEDSEERARHLAAAANGPEAAAAASLDAAAQEAQSRGAPDVAAELTELAIQLTAPDALHDLHLRRLAAADFHFQAGSGGHARLLLETAVATAATDRDRGEALFHLATVRGEAEDLRVAMAIYEEALRNVAAKDEALRTEVCINAAFAAAERDLALAEHYAQQALASAERLAEPSLLAQALTAVGWVRFFQNRRIDRTVMERAVALERAANGLWIDRSPSFALAAQYNWSGELEEGRRLLHEIRRRALRAGDVSVMAALHALASLERRAGNVHLTAQYAHATHELALQSGRDAQAPDCLCLLAYAHAFFGENEEARRLASSVLTLPPERLAPGDETMARNALGLAHLSAGEYEKAREHLAPTFESRHVVSGPAQSLAESLPIEIEVLAHLGAIDEAEEKLRWLEGPGFPLDRLWGLGTTARCRGLIAAARGNLEGALAELSSAVAHHQRGARPFDLARSLFALGTVQRRHGVKREAREALQQALEIFEQLGARLWAERARAELARLGGRPVQTRELTVTERQIATLVAAGKSNHEVSRVVHLSPKTVEWNLSKIYRKLRVRSRTELAAKLAK